MLRIVSAAIVALMLVAKVLGVSPAAAQPYPSKQITLIVPFAAGGPSDTISRLIGAKMGEHLGQSFIIENIAGAGGTVAADRVSKLPADGYTLLVHHIALPLGAALYQNLKYDTATAFDTLGLINTGPYVLTTRTTFPANTPGELFAVLKSGKERVTFAHAGVGSGSHLCGLLLMQTLGFKADFVAYRGTGPALNDVVAGHVDVLCDQTTNTFPQISEKKIKAFAITSKDRAQAMPDIPTMQEVGLPNMDVAVWHALYAPKGLPADVKAKLAAALEVALNDPAIKQRFEQLGTFLFPTGQRGPEAHRAKLDTEIVRLRKIVESAGISAEAK